LAVLEHLSAIAETLGSPGSVSLPARLVNEQGARCLGILPDAGPARGAHDGKHTGQIMEAVGHGELPFLWVSQANIARDFWDPEIAVKGLEEAPFLVYSGLHLAREEWRIAAALAARLGQPMPYASWRDILRDIAATVPGWDGIDPDCLGDGGIQYAATSLKEETLS